MSLSIANSRSLRQILSALTTPWRVASQLHICWIPDAVSLRTLPVEKTAQAVAAWRDIDGPWRREVLSIGKTMLFEERSWTLIVMSRARQLCDRYCSSTHVPTVFFATTIRWPSEQ